MRRSPYPRIAVLALLLAATLVVEAAPTGDPGLSGRWVLAEQTYEKGGANLAARSKPLYLEVAVGAARPEVRVWPGGEISRARSWPALLEHGTQGAQIELLEKSIDPTAGRLTTRYRISPPDEGEWELDVRESYALSADGEALVGSMTVEMSHEGSPRGGYVLQRRFERESP